jgi:acetoin utilization protein AcuC
MNTKNEVLLYADPDMAGYNFGPDHPFGPKRLEAFRRRFRDKDLERQVTLCHSRPATREEIESFHDPDYVSWVIEQCKSDRGGYLDGGDTPAAVGLPEAAALVVGSVLDAVRRVVDGDQVRAFVPISGQHHAGRRHASGFCVLNDAAVAVEILRAEYGIHRIAYVDVLDAHHADGVFYAYENDRDLIFADIHEDGRFLFPGTGSASERGSGQAYGTKLNIPMEPGAGDGEWTHRFEQVVEFLESFEPEFFIVQVGADGLKDDPLSHLNYTTEAHRTATQSLCDLAARYADGRIVSLGGGGYEPRGTAEAWTIVVEEML